LISWSYDVLRAAGCNPVVVVVPEETLNVVRGLLGPAVVLATGGETRRDSVRSGLETISSDLVVVHDAARPFVSVGLVAAVLDRLRDYDGAICAVPVTETLKETSGQVVVETVDRARLYRAQTPQAFKTGVLKRAHERALRDRFDPTDDAQLVERCGGRVGLVEGSHTNVKITYSEDFHLAEAYARSLEDAR
jgi:2-C-methyl-D-erythritol 4-phosphate cytidylyltransferase